MQVSLAKHPHNGVSNVKSLHAHTSRDTTDRPSRWHNVMVTIVSYTLQNGETTQRQRSKTFFDCRDREMPIPRTSGSSPDINILSLRSCFGSTQAFRTGRGSRRRSVPRCHWAIVPATGAHAWPVRTLQMTILCRTSCRSAAAKSRKICYQEATQKAHGSRGLRKEPQRWPSFQNLPPHGQSNTEGNPPDFLSRHQRSGWSLVHKVAEAQRRRDEAEGGRASWGSPWSAQGMPLCTQVRRVPQETGLAH